MRRPDFRVSTEVGHLPVFSDIKIKRHKVAHTKLEKSVHLESEIEGTYQAAWMHKPICTHIVRQRHKQVFS